MTKYPRLRFLLLVALPIWLGVFLGILLGEALSQPKPGFIVTGTLDAAPHEAQDGFYSIGELTIAVPRESAPAVILRGLVGQPVELTVQRVEPRTVKRLER